MKFTINIQGYKVLLSAQQLETIIDALGTPEYIGEEHVGRGNGDCGYDMQYRMVLRQFSTVEKLQLNVVADDTVETIRLSTKMFDESKK
jgi:hypothetical protein